MLGDFRKGYIFHLDEVKESFSVCVLPQVICLHQYTHVSSTMYTYIYVIAIAPLGGMLLVYKHDTRGRYAPEGECL